MKGAPGVIGGSDRDHVLHALGQIGGRGGGVGERSRAYLSKVSQTMHFARNELRIVRAPHRALPKKKKGRNGQLSSVDHSYKNRGQNAESGEPMSVSLGTTQLVVIRSERIGEAEGARRIPREKRDRDGPLRATRAAS